MVGSPQNRARSTTIHRLSWARYNSATTWFPATFAPAQPLAHLKSEIVWIDGSASDAATSNWVGLHGGSGVLTKGRHAGSVTSARSSRGEEALAVVKGVARSSATLSTVARCLLTPSLQA